MKNIKIADFEISNKKNLILIAGPCVIESESHSLMMAEKIATVCQKQKINFVYKSSFDKANRSSINSNRGIELNQAEKIFNKINTFFKTNFCYFFSHHQGMVFTFNYTGTGN